MRALICLLAILEALTICYLTNIQVDRSFNSDNMQQAYEFGCLLGQVHGRYLNPLPADDYCFRYSKMFKDGIDSEVE